MLFFSSCSRARADQIGTGPRRISSIKVRKHVRSEHAHRLDGVLFTRSYALPDATSVQSFWRKRRRWRRDSSWRPTASNGASAATSNRERVDEIIDSIPLFCFSVRAEMDQSSLFRKPLIHPPQRAAIEYAFGCGCDVLPSPHRSGDPHAILRLRGSTNARRLSRPNDPRELSRRRVRSTEAAGG